MRCSCRCPHRQNFQIPAASDGGSYNASRFADFQRSVALLITHRLFKRQDDNSATQTSDENRRRIFVIADLDGDYASIGELVDLWFEAPRAFINSTERPIDLAAGIKNGGLVALLSENRLPSLQQYVFRFHPLRKMPRRLHSALIFDDESRHSPRISRDRYRLRVRSGLSHPLDAS